VYKNNLDKLLAQKYDISSILLYGESEFFIDYYSTLIESHFPNADKISLYFEEYKFNTASEYLSQSSLFGDINLLVIKTDSKIPKKELDKLVDITLKNSNSYLIYKYLGTDFKTLTSSFSPKGCEHVRFFKPNITESIGYLSQKAQSLSLQMDSTLLKYLLDSQDLDVALALKELEKLALQSEPISINIIDKICFNLSSSDTNSVIYDILDKKDFKEHLFRLFDDSEDEIRFLTTLTSFLVTLLEFSMYARLYGQVDSKDILGYKLPKFVEQKYSMYATRISISSFAKMIEFLQQRELYLKQNIKVDKSAFLYSTLSKLQTYF
jgi:DNA polymerase-3 subunit delta